MDKLSFERACEILNRQPVLPARKRGIPAEDHKRALAEYQLNVFMKATNRLDNNFTPVWTNANQPKYTCWLRYDYSLGSFVLCDSICTDTFTHLGARFWFRSPETARGFFECYAELINELHTY